MFYCNLKQEFPLKNYYNDLFPVNFNTNFLVPTTAIQDKGVWATYDKSRLVNLEDVIDAGAVIQNKMFFDNGKGTVSGTVAMVLLVLAIVFALTSVMGFCPLYAPFGFSTCPLKEKQ